MTKVSKLKPLDIPLKLTNEFRTVEAVLMVPDSESSTPNLDGFVLAWVKYEKQVRKLFCYLVYQDKSVEKDNWKRVQKAITDNDELNTKILIREIHGLTERKIFCEVADAHPALIESIDGIRKVRNKIMHGQVTGKGLSAEQLRKHTQDIVDWMDLIRQAALESYHYDGVERDTYQAANDGRQKVVPKYPFDDYEGLLKWIKCIKRDMPKPGVKRNSD